MTSTITSSLMLEQVTLPGGLLCARESAEQPVGPQTRGQASSQVLDFPRSRRGPKIALTSGMTACAAEDQSPTLFYSSVSPLLGHPRRGDQAEMLRTIAACNRRGHVALCNRDLDAAEQHFRDALELRQRAGASAHLGLPQAFGRLGVVAVHRGDLSRAETLFELGLEVARALRSRLTPADAMILQNLGVVARRLGRFADAESRHAGALSIKVQALGWMHPSVATTLGSLGVLSLLQRHPAEALERFKHALEIATSVSGERSTCVAQLQLGCGCAHVQLGRDDQAERCFAAAVAVYETIPGSSAPLARSRLHLADARWRRDPAGARRLAQATLTDHLTSAHPDPQQLRCMHTWLEGHVEHAA